MQPYLTFFAIVGSLLVYLFAVRAARKVDKAAGTPDTAAKYFTSPGSVAPPQFASAQIAYALQMATVYPFFRYAFSGMWWIAIINTAFYIVGISLFYFFLPYFAKKLRPLLGSSLTVHAHIADLNSAPELRYVTASMTVLSFTGLAAIEILWGAQALRIVLGGTLLTYYLSVATLAVYLIVYVWAGGQWAAIRADQYQLFLSYVGLHLLVAWVVWQPGVDLSSLTIPILAFTIVAIGGMMFFYRAFVIQWRSISLPLRALNLATLSSLLIMVGSLLWRSKYFVGAMQRAITETSDAGTTHWSYLLVAVSVALPPIFFQFVDMTNWQRLVAVSSTPENRVSESRRGLVQYAIESPLSWLMPIIIGLCCAKFLAVPKGSDPWNVLLNTGLSLTGPLGPLISIFIFVGITAIFLSTSTGLLTAIGYATSFDLVPLSRKLVDKRHSALTNAMSTPLDAPPQQPANVTGQDATADDDQAIELVGRLGFTLATVAAILLFMIVVPVGGDSLMGIFWALYTPLLVIAPSLFVPAVFGRKAHPAFAMVSIVGGAILGIGCGVCSIIWPETLGGLIKWIASPIAIPFAWLVYLTGLIWGSEVVIDSQAQAIEGESL